MLDKLTIDDFRKRTDQKFSLDSGSGAKLELKLTQVRKMTERELGKDERVPFALEFRGPRTPVFEQRIYLLENADLGRLEIFLVPIGPDSQGMIYEAVFT